MGCTLGALKERSFVMHMETPACLLPTLAGAATASSAPSASAAHSAASQQATGPGVPAAAAAASFLLSQALSALCNQW